MSRRESSRDPGLRSFSAAVACLSSAAPAKRRRRPVTLVGLAIATAGAIFFVGPRPAFALKYAEPPAAQSYYEYSTSTALAAEEGCEDALDNGEFDYNSMVILDFGGQLANRTGTLSTNGKTKFKNAQIEAIAKEFANGYFECEYGYATVHLDIGTNNSYDAVSAAGGKAWAEVVKNVANYVLESKEKTKVVSIYGGDDLEDGYSSGGKALDWARSYSENTNSPYVNYGDAGGCPETSHENGPCAVENGFAEWNQQVEYEVSWQIYRAHGTPEIYHLANAKQWAEIALYGNGHFGGGIQFEGPLDQDGAESSNSPHEAWYEFEESLEANGLNADIIFSLTI